ncbi:cholinesterase, putative [Coccidioides posadasii C735 delta SOWgp]|uniref:Carboxylic ester hydrolase n=1 Tax=Coccidioides posadasii (strain C735) TaxID=222929 RepID=C5PE69_COCP7|nr:cholinesterase, putative [Coccidioides posadasii C735 delta SOWgp]EER24802.1 cholinesterase, putative [Coccidioides posadasii C735 delta SOWgp]|eukprot:XP_003066947.1 cholinesterase, putative [Coccidioides posadasii C735 delta SOWgp]
MKLTGRLCFAAVSLFWGVLGDCLTVNTTNGLITGHPAPFASGVKEFLGIPYAKAPVGQLRFKPPQRYVGNEPYVASNFVSTADCVFTPSKLVAFPDATPNFAEIFTSFTGGRGNPQSEDCLTLNIWTKGLNNAKRPVLVFFYGGRFTTGDTNTPFYNGQFFSAAEDVIVVTVNYRVSIFGFPGAPGQTQNLGLRDQRLAVEWLRDNVKAFGGDPKKITIFGQSSGSLSVDAYAFAYTQDPIVAGLIEHSGTIFSFDLNSRELATKHWYNASALVGCGSQGDVLPCMMSKSAVELKAAAASVKPPPNTSVARSQPVFQPVPDGDIVFDDYHSLASQGKFARVPMIVGHTDQESSFYNISAWARGSVLTDAEWAQFVTDVFNCPSMEEADYRNNYHVPVWRYRYFADWDNTRLFPNSAAYHGVDLHMIFGNSQGVTGDPESPAQTQLKKTMQKAWATFAANPWTGLRDLGWPMYRKNANTLIRLGYNNNPVPSFINPATYDADCAVV